MSGRNFNQEFESANSIVAKRGQYYKQLSRLHDETSKEQHVEHPSNSQHNRAMEQYEYPNDSISFHMDGGNWGAGSYKVDGLWNEDYNNDAPDHSVCGEDESYMNFDGRGDRVFNDKLAKDLRHLAKTLESLAEAAEREQAIHGRKKIRKNENGIGECPLDADYQ